MISSFVGCCYSKMSGELYRKLREYLFQPAELDKGTFLLSASSSSIITLSQVPHRTLAARVYSVTKKAACSSVRALLEASIALLKTRPCASFRARSSVPRAFASLKSLLTRTSVLLSPPVIRPSSFTFTRHSPAPLRAARLVL